MDVHGETVPGWVDIDAQGWGSSVSALVADAGFITMRKEVLALRLRDRLRETYTLLEASPLSRAVLLPCIGTKRALIESHHALDIRCWHHPEGLAMPGAGHFPHLDVRVRRLRSSSIQLV
jgi:hypothetical protein